MKVIKKDRIQICPYCNTKLSFNEDDIETTHIVNDTFIRCCVCGQRIFYYTGKK